MTKNGSSHTILLVEDEFPVAMEEARMLEQHGFAVMTVYDARTAIDTVKNTATDLILMDIELGERNMDGSEAAQVIQKDHDVPIVFLTGHAEKEYVDRVKEITNYGYVLKNSGEFVLIESVNGALKLFEAHQRKRGEKFLHATLNGLSTHIALLDNRGDIVFVNEAWRRFAEDNGVAADEVSEGAHYLEVCEEATGESSEGAREFAEAIRNIINGDDASFSREYPCHSPEANRWFIGKVSPIRIGDDCYVVAAHENITELKHTETRLQKSLNEKDFLMRELNHRIKNNLIMVQSLIRLKDSALGDAVDLSDISSRIDAIRIVHEKLHRAKEIAHIDLREYIKELLSTVFSLSRRRVETEYNISDISIPARTAIPIGLIVNEIATNAIKHGFNEEEARLTVDLREDTSENKYILEVSNTGRPFPAGINFDNPATLGLQLISGLVQQLDGSIELQREPHPVFTIRFPMEEGS